MKKSKHIASSICGSKQTKILLLTISSKSCPEEQLHTDCTSQHDKSEIKVEDKEEASSCHLFRRIEEISKRLESL